MQQNICCINHHWDWEHLFQVKTTFLVALQGEIRNSVLQQAGKNKSAWLDGPTLQGFCYFWWDKEQTNNWGTACSGSRLHSGKSSSLRQAVSHLLGKCLENTNEPLQQCCETHHQELGPPQAKPGLFQLSWYRKPPASWGCLEGGFGYCLTPSAPCFLKGFADDVNRQQRNVH